MAIDAFTLDRTIFLLGGHDLEMDTILNLLKKYKIPFLDKHLTWENANLSEYENDIRKVLKKSPDIIIYGVELRNDLCLSSSETKIFETHYKTIDHHSIIPNRPSSLEQVAELIGHQMTDYEKEVAINDVSHIRGLEERGLSKSEIDKIRKKDRLAQGITSKDEDLAEKSIKDNLIIDGRLYIVTTSLKRFSPIVDRLHPCDSLLVISEENHSFCYFGKMARHMTDVANRDYWNVYFGGGECGYYGGTLKRDIPLDKEEEQLAFLISTSDGSLQHRVKAVLDSPVSQHIFILPFKYDPHVSVMPKKVWQRIPRPMLENRRDWEELFDEKQYFFQYVHDALYDNGNESSHISHYERQIHNGVYRISTEVKDYTLLIKSLNVNLYSTGIGTLSFYLDNFDHNQASPEDILRINQYGRRVMLPFLRDQTTRIETAKQQSITLPDEAEGDFITYSEDYEQFKESDVWKLASFIEKIIEELNPRTPISIQPVIDDRMFVLSWYKSSDLMEEYLRGDKDFWYRFLFIDGNDATCQSDNMKQELLKKHTYPRWENYGTLYGVSRYSMVMLTTDGAQWGAPHLFHSFRSIYTRMAELVLCQRASILLFNERIRNNEFKKDVSSIYNDYLVFLNQFCLDEVTAQEQGIELYDMLWESSRIKSLSKELEAQINATNDLKSLSFDKNVSSIATFVLPVTVIASLVSLLQLGPQLSKECVWWIISLVIVIGGAASFWLWRKYFKKNQN